VNVNKRVVAAIAAVVLAVLGIVSLVAYANQANDRAFEGTELVSAIRVVDKVPAGTKASDLSSSVEVVELPKAAVPETALTSLDSVSGQVATAVLVPGEVLVTGRFGTAAEVNGGEKVTVPKGMQEVTIKLATVRALDGKLSAGDTVGVVASYDDVRRTNFAINKVLVLSSRETAAADTTGTAGEAIVRLALRSTDAGKIIHAAEFGHLYLTKQGKDAAIDRQLITTEGVVK
jgi:pilus assembly protein CpaB